MNKDQNEEKQRLNAKYLTLLLREIGQNFDEDMANLLIKGGKLDVNMVSQDGVTPLISACLSIKPKVVEFLLSNKAKVSVFGLCPDVGDTSWKQRRIKATALHAVLGSARTFGQAYEVTDCLNIVSQLISKGADPEKRDDNDRNTLFWLRPAASLAENIRFEEDYPKDRRQHQTGDGDKINAVLIKTLEVLLDNGGKVEKKDKSGTTPLHHFAKRGDSIYIDIIKKRGLLVDVKDSSGFKVSEVAALELRRSLDFQTKIKESEKKDFTWESENDEYHSEWESWASQKAEADQKVIAYQNILKAYGIELVDQEKLMTAVQKKLSKNNKTDNEVSKKPSIK